MTVEKFLGIGVVWCGVPLLSFCSPPALALNFRGIATDFDPVKVVLQLPSVWIEGGIVWSFGLYNGTVAS